MIVLSPAFASFLKSYGWVDHEILTVAALILGRSFNLIPPQRHDYLDFVRSLISGDLDADKIDYVARDAYMAGIPIAADVERLISQIQCIRYRPKAAGDLTAYVLGISRAGISAAEMFILARAYLFDRLYQHPKVRAVERTVELGLSEIFTSSYDGNEPGFLAGLFCLTGDDGHLQEMSARAEASKQKPNIFSSILNRQIPERALALSPRITYGYVKRPIPSIIQAWSIASDHLIQNPSDLASLMVKVGKISSEQLLIVDAAKPAPIKPNPEIYIADFEQSDAALIPISEHFDIAQLAQAYDDVKKTNWIFASERVRVRAAAAAATVMAADFGIMPTDLALNRAKIKPDRFNEEIDRIIAHLNSGTASIKQDHTTALLTAASQIKERHSQNLSFPIQLIQQELRFKRATDSYHAALTISEGIRNAGAKLFHIEEISATLRVLGVVSDIVSKAISTSTRKHLDLSEGVFKKEVVSDLMDDFDYVRHEEQNADGRVDIVASRDTTPGFNVAIELKAEPLPFAELVEKHFRQALAYATTPNFSRVSILFVRFADDSPQSLSAPITIKEGPDKNDFHAVICIGQQSKSGTASEIG